MSKRRSIAKAVEDYNRFTESKGNNTGAFYVSDIQEVKEIATTPMGGGRASYSNRDSSRSGLYGRVQGSPETLQSTLEGLLEQYNQLYRDSKTGKYSPADIKAQIAVLDAKRDTLYRISGDLTKEEESGLVNMADLFNKEYESKLLRRDA